MVDLVANWIGVSPSRLECGLIVVGAPCVDDPASVAVAYEQVLVEAFVLQPADEQLHEAVLHWLARCNLVSFDLGLLLPLEDGV